MIRLATFHSFVHLTSVVIVIAALYSLISNDQGKQKSDVEDPLVFVSVISARDHYEQRAAVRQTWGKWTGEADLKFVIGQECVVPPDDRDFDQGCTEVSWKHGTSYDQTFWSNTFTSSYPAQQTVKGFAFIANFPIVLNSVKLAKWGQTPGQTVVTVKNAHTNDQLDSLQFFAFSQREAELKTQPYLLPRGFEGIVQVAGDLPASNSSCHLWADHGNYFKITWLVDNDTTLPVNSKDFCVPVAISFQFTGAEDFVRERDNRRIKWRSHLTEISKKLDEENKQHKDLLFVKTVDVYRNLTSKMLDILHWTAKHRKTSFLLKVDDDTFVDFERVERYIKRVANNVADKVWWLADLKENWLVSRYGKWRDDVYLSSSYPPFPCGAAYVISPHFVSLLGRNATFLRKYPFEDTALGLWTSAANLSPILGRIDECAMDCGTRQPDCNVPACFILQCESGDMQRFMTSHVRRGFVC